MTQSPSVPVEGISASSGAAYTRNPFPGYIINKIRQGSLQNGSSVHLGLVSSLQGVMLTICWGQDTDREA